MIHPDPNASLLARLFTISRWLPSYNLQTCRRDLVAGLTVGIMLVPQSMAYALLAGVPPVYGLYASLVPLLAYPLFGTSRQLATGVIAIDMLIVAAGLAPLADPSSPRYVELAIVLALMVGIVQIVMGLGRIGFIVNLLSRPVMTGFASGAALIIMLSQVGSLTGMKIANSPHLHDLIASVVGSAQMIHPLTSLVGLLSLGALVLVKYSSRRIPGPLLVTVVGTAAVWWLSLDTMGLAVVGAIPSGLPSPGIPALRIDDFGDLLVTAVTLSLVQFMTVVTLGKVFAAKHRYSIRPNRELFALGVANLAGSFFRSIPVSGSFSRSAVNDQAGAQTPMANVVAAGMVVLTLVFFVPLIRFLPIAVLAAIIIVAAFSLFDIRAMCQLWALKRIDGVISVATFLVTILIGIQQGVLTGIALSVIAIMYRISVPNVAELGHVPGTRSFRNIDNFPDARKFFSVLILRVDASFSFANAEFLKTLLDTRTRRDTTIRHILIDASSINDMDTTAADALLGAAAMLRSRDVELYFAASKSAVEDIMRDVGLVELIGEDHLFLSPYRAIVSILRTNGNLDSLEEGAGVPDGNAGDTDDADGADQ